MSTPVVLPTQLPDPIFGQPQAVDPQTGNLTEQHWWFLFSLRNAAATAIQNSTLNSVQLVPSGGTVTPDLSLSGPLGSFELAASATQVTILDPIYTGGVVPNGAQITIFFDEDEVGGRPGPLWQTGPGGFAPEMNTLAIIEEANTRTTYRLGYDGVSWTLLSFETGQTI
jgi:hypothetical protein